MFFENRTNDSKLANHGKKNDVRQVRKLFFFHWRKKAQHKNPRINRQRLPEKFAAQTHQKD